MQFIKIPDGFAFTSSIKDIIINPGGNIPVKFSIKMGNTIVLPEETYYRNSDGVIIISDVGNILSAWLKSPRETAYLLDQQTTVADFTFVYSDHNSEYQNTHKIMRSDVEFDMTAGAFCSTHFLTLMFATKKTALGRRELLSFFSTSEGLKATVTVYYLVNGQLSTEAKERIPVGTGLVKYLDVSPSIFASENKKLLYYIVQVEQRTMRYEVDYTPFLQQTHFVYRNAFGVEDTFSCTGEASSEGKYERYYATFSGSYKNFKRKNLREFSVDTGILTQAGAYALDDMFSSDEIWLYDNLGLIKEVVILDQKVPRSSLPNEAPRFEFSYRLAQNNQRYKTAEYGRIFDSTFDKTFN